MTAYVGAFEVALYGRPERLNRGLEQLLFADSFDGRGDESGGVSFVPGESLAEFLPSSLAELIALLAASGLRRRTGS